MRQYSVYRILSHDGTFFEEMYTDDYAAAVALATTIISETVRYPGAVLIFDHKKSEVSFVPARKRM